jgi:hypothetical protein
MLAGGHDKIYPPEHEIFSRPSSPPAAESPKCRSGMCRAPAIFPGATA